MDGQHAINICYMKMGRLSPRGQAMMVLGLDDPVPPGSHAGNPRLAHVNGVRLVEI